AESPTDRLPHRCHHDSSNCGLPGGVMYRNIMVPVDGSSFSREAVVHGLRIASRCGANLRLVRVAVAPIALGGPDGYTIENESLRQLRAEALADLYSIA